MLNISKWNCTHAANGRKKNPHLTSQSVLGRGGLSREHRRTAPGEFKLVEEQKVRIDQDDGFVATLVVGQKFHSPVMETVRFVVEFVRVSEIPVQDLPASVQKGSSTFPIGERSAELGHVRIVGSEVQVRMQHGAIVARKFCRRRGGTLSRGASEGAIGRGDVGEVPFHLPQQQPMGEDVGIGAPLASAHVFGSLLETFVVRSTQTMAEQSICQWEDVRRCSMRSCDLITPDEATADVAREKLTILKQST